MVAKSGNAQADNNNSFANDQNGNVARNITNGDIIRGLNAIAIEKTAVSTTAVQLTFPEASNFFITHQTIDGLLYIGSSNTVDATSLLLEKDDILEISESSDIEIWAIAGSGSITVFAVATLKE